MPSELIVVGAFANCGQDPPTESLLEVLAKEAKDLAVFRFQPKPRPGVRIKAAFDWQAILGTGADLLAFGGLIWAAYERYIKPKLITASAGQKPFLFVSLRKPDGTFIQFGLGNEYTEKDVFIESFTRQATTIRSSTSDNGSQSLETKISEHEDWVRVSVRSDGDA